MKAAGIPLGEYVEGQIYYGIKTGFNKAFVIDGAKREELISQDPNSAEIIKPFAVGKDVRKWIVDYKDRWLIFTRRGIDIKRYPAIEEHLAHWKVELTPKGASREEVGRKPGPYRWYEIQDNIAYHAVFDEPKIMYNKFLVKPRFAFDAVGAMTNDATFLIPREDFYLLGVFNTQAYWREIEHHCTKIQNGYQLIWKYLQKTIIPNAPAADCDAIAELVQKCLDARGVGCEEWEAEIDERVAALYGL